MLVEPVCRIACYSCTNHLQKGMPNVKRMLRICFGCVRTRGYLWPERERERERERDRNRERERERDREREREERKTERERERGIEG